MMKFIRKQYKKYKYIIDFIQTIRMSDRVAYEGLRIGKEGQLVTEAQRLHASVYLSRNFVSETDVSTDGRLHEKADPHQSHATYFAVRSKKTGRVIATSRQIELHADKKYLSFPMMEKAQIEEKWRNYILSHSMESIVEISGLAKHRDGTNMAPLYLYRQMWHHSLRQKHDLWLMACDVRLYQRLKIILGDAIVQIGEETHYQGGNVIPALVKPRQSLHALIKSAINATFLQRYLRLLVVEFFIEGLPMHTVATSDRKELKKIGILKGKG